MHITYLPGGEEQGEGNEDADEGDANHDSEGQLPLLNGVTVGGGMYRHDRPGRAKDVTVGREGRDGRCGARNIDGETPPLADEQLHSL